MSGSIPSTPAMSYPTDGPPRRPRRIRWLLFCVGLLMILLTGCAAFVVYHGRTEELLIRIRGLAASVMGAQRQPDKELDRIPVTISQPQTTVPSQVIAGSGNDLASGDQLRITFHERSGVPLRQDSSGTTQSVTIVYPRMDMTGDYTISDAGFLNIPGLGQITADGKATAMIEAELTEMLARSMGRRIDVRITITDRLPVYVIGEVRVPGSLKYLPGMIALQALAGAGGNGASATDISREIEYIREGGRLQHAHQVLDRLLVKQALLAAKERNAAAIVPPSALAHRLSRQDAGDQVRHLIAEAEAALRDDQQRTRARQKLAANRTEVLKLQISAQQVRLEQLDILLGKQQGKLRRVEAINEKGSIPQYRIAEIQVEVADIEARKADVLVSLAQVQRQWIEADIENAKLVTDRANAITSELMVVFEQIDRIESEIATSKAVMSALGNPTAVDVDATDNRRMTIVRHMPTGLIVIKANNETRLRPGDVIQVGAAPGGEQRVLTVTGGRQNFND